jgi:hypothetical protein
MSERIEPAMLKGVFPAPYQPITVTTAFFKSPPTAVLPAVVVTVIVFKAFTVTVIVMLIIAVSAITLPIIAVSAIVLPAVAITVAPSPILSEGA